MDGSESCGPSAQVLASCCWKCRLQAHSCERKKLPSQRFWNTEFPTTFFFWFFFSRIVRLCCGAITPPLTSLWSPATAALTHLNAGRVKPPYVVFFKALLQGGVVGVLRLREGAPAALPGVASRVVSFEYHRCVITLQVEALLSV